MARFFLFFTFFHLSLTFFRPEVRFKSAIQEVINSGNKLFCLPKQEDKECSLCLKFNTVVEAQ